MALAGSRNFSVLPGFGPSLGYTVVFLSLVVLIPIAEVILKTLEMDWASFWSTVSSPRIVATYKVSLGAALLAAAINSVFGLVLAWALVRYSFPGKKIVDALIDLPFALPTAVAGIALTAFYPANGWLDSLLEPLRINLAFPPVGVLIALVFIGLPFIVRTVPPIIGATDIEIEEANACLGANSGKTFWYVVLPLLWPPLQTG